MNKKMYELKLFTDDSDIIISQSGNMEAENRVVIHLDQIDTLIKWLQEAKHEYEKENQNNYYECSF